MVVKKFQDGGRQARRFEIFESASQFRIESGRPIRIRIESGSFAGPDQKACKPLFLAVTEI